MGKYGTMLKKTYKEEIGKIYAAYQQHGHDESTLARIRHWLHMDESTLQEREKQDLANALRHSQRLQMLYDLKQELAMIWSRSTATQEQLLHRLQDWCHRAELSGEKALQDFSYRLRCYKMA